MQHSCGSAQSRTPPVLTSSPGSVRACSSKVRLRRASTWPLFLQALWPSAYADVLRRYRTHPLRSRVRRLHTPLASGHKAFRASRKQPFRLLAQTVSVIPSLVLGLRLHPSAVLPATDCAVIPLQRRCILPLFEGQCMFAETVLPRATVLPRSLLWAVPAQAGEAVCHPQRRSLPLFQGARGLPSTALQSPPSPTLPDRLPGHAPLRSAPLVTDGLTGGPRIDVRGNAGDISRIDPAACETVSNQGQPGAHARTSVQHRPASPARRPEKRYIYSPKEAAADAAAGAFRLD